jgi:hypothetical protein
MSVFKSPFYASALFFSRFFFCFQKPVLCVCASLDWPFSGLGLSLRFSNMGFGFRFGFRASGPVHSCKTGYGRKKN